MTEFEHVGVAVPRRGQDGHSGIESRNCELKNPPEEIVAIVRFEADGSNGGGDFGLGSREEAWEDIHECGADLRIP